MRALIEEEDNDSNADAKDVDVLQGFDYRTIIRESLTLEDLVTTQFIFLNVTVYISWVAMISGSMRSRSSLYCRIDIWGSDGGAQAAHLGARADRSGPVQYMGGRQRLCDQCDWEEV